MLVEWFMFKRELIAGNNELREALKNAEERAALFCRIVEKAEKAGFKLKDCLKGVK